jgi:hypothetical protein
MHALSGSEDLRLKRLCCWWEPRDGNLGDRSHGEGVIRGREMMKSEKNVSGMSLATSKSVSHFLREYNESLPSIFLRGSRKMVLILDLRSGWLRRWWMS